MFIVYPLTAIHAAEEVLLTLSSINFHRNTSSSWLAKTTVLITPKQRL
jgi:hypothetical protein